MASEGLITKLGLLCSLAGLAAIYGATAQFKPAVTAIANLDEEFLGLRVAISGKVVDLKEHIDGHLFLKLRDDSGGIISVPIFSALRSKLQEPIELLDVVQVTGTVEKYRGELEVIPGRPGDVRVVHAPATGIQNLDEGRAGELVKVEGTIVDRSAAGGGLLLTLREDGADLRVFVPASVVRGGLPELQIGHVVRIGGLLQLYREQLELKLGDASHLRVLEAA